MAEMKVYADERGEIIDVAEMPFSALQIIRSVKGSVRSNHYHKTGGHLLYVLSGRMRYVEKPVPEGEQIEWIVDAGQSVFTGPMLAHMTEFLEDTVLVCCATVPRAGEAYADDLVRMQLV